MKYFSVWVFLALGFVLGMATEGRLRREAYAVRMLLHLSAPLPKANAAALAPGSTPRREDLVVGEGRGAAHGRLYFPDGAVHRCAVVGHGVHYKGIDEPRLVRFSTELARAGVLVLTPELRELADYRITRSGADVLSASVVDLSRRCASIGGGRVGLLGFSFAGGLALLAATDPEISAHLAYVGSVGGYDDLGRVLSFLLTDTVETLHGKEPRAAHEYGVVVLLYGHLEALVPSEDLGVMTEAVRAWLHEDRAGAWAIASLRTTSRAEELFVRLATGHAVEYRGELGALLAASTAEERELSPRGRLASIPVPVLLLHGTGDSVIPPEETLWASRELGDHVHRALLTPLIEHVELSHAPKLTEAFALVDFIAALL